MLASLRVSGVLLSGEAQGVGGFAPALQSEKHPGALPPRAAGAKGRARGRRRASPNCALKTLRLGLALPELQQCRRTLFQVGERGVRARFATRRAPAFDHRLRPEHAADEEHGGQRRRRPPGGVSPAG